MIDEKGYSTCSLNHEGVKCFDASKIPGPISDRLWRVLLLSSLLSPNSMMGHMMCLYYPSLSAMADKGYFMMWGIVEFKAFHASLC